MPSFFDKLKFSLTGGSDDPPVRIESFPLHVFGKLPVYKDFISSGLTDEPSREFRDWLSNGFSHRWSSREDCKEAEIPPHGFLVKLPDSRKFVTGVLWGSHDQGGLRRFPFALFSVIPTGGATASPTTALDYLSEYERRAGEIREKYGENGSLSAFYEAYRGKKVGLPVRTHEQLLGGLRSELKGVSVGTFAESLLGEGAAEAWPRFLSSFPDAVERSARHGAGALRLPLGNELSPIDQAKFWFLYLRRIDPNGDVTPCGFLYSHARPSGRFTLFFRDLRAEDIYLLHPTLRDYDHVEEHSTCAGATGDGSGASPSGWEAPLSSLLATSA